MDIKDKISKWIRSSRKSAGLSGEDLGARLAFELGAEKGHSKANISHWELGRHEPSFSQILAISKITKCPLPIDIGQLTYDSKKQSVHPDIQAVIEIMDGIDDDGKTMIRIKAQELAIDRKAFLSRMLSNAPAIPTESAMFHPPVPSHKKEKA